MVDSTFLLVQFTYRTHKFKITSEMHADRIRNKIGRYFRINMEKFLLEVFDKHFNMYFVLDDAYLTKLRNNPYISVENLLIARIRSLNQSRYNIQFDTIAIEDPYTEKVSPQPDHIVVWLDKHIGRPQCYQQMKKHFKSIIAIDWSNLFSSKTTQDIDNLIRINDNEVVKDSNLNDIRDEIYAFSTSEDCLIFIDKVSKSHRNIFLICSGSLGEKFVPEIYHNKFVHSIFILTFDIQNHYEWASDYIEKIQIFTHELDLLARLARDIAAYYEKKSSNDIANNPRHSLAYLYWTKRLFTNANIVDDYVTSNRHLQRINKRIIELEENLISKHDNEEREKSGITCTEL